MFDLDSLVGHVQQNCDISDARHAGRYSMCTFLLKMREYYRWRKNIPLSSTLTRDDVGDWLVKHEQHWEILDDSDYGQIPLNGACLDPFDSDAINADLLAKGYIYSSGRGLFNKPHFFVGELLKHQQHDDIDVYFSGKEFARDLVAPPAMLREDKIFIRTQSIRRFIWEKIEENRWRHLKQSPIIQSALCYGIDIRQQDISHDTFEILLDKMTETESHSALQHELGEVAAGRKLTQRWEKMLATIAGSKAEHIARAVRDHLADALSTLPWLIKPENVAALHFYFGNFTGLRKLLFPQALNAYNRWLETADDSQLKSVCLESASPWLREAQHLLDFFSTDNDQNLAEKIILHHHVRQHPLQCFQALRHFNIHHVLDYPAIIGAGHGI